MRRASEKYQPDHVVLGEDGHLWEGGQRFEVVQALNLYEMDGTPAILAKAGDILIYRGSRTLPSYQPDRKGRLQMSLLLEFGGIVYRREWGLGWDQYLAWIPDPPVHTRRVA